MPERADLPERAAPCAYRSLEGLRFIAAFAVIVYHYRLYVAQSWPSIDRVFAHFNVFVDLFFVISGFVIALVYRGRITGVRAYAEFMRRRIARLYPLHLATLVVFVAIGLAGTAGLLQLKDPARYDVATIIPNLALVHAWGTTPQLTYNYASWSISAEFLVYLAFPLLLWLVERRPLIGLAAVATLLAGAIAISQGAFGEPLPELTFRFGILRAIPGFAFGVWLFVNADTLDRLVGPDLAIAAFHACVPAFLAALILHAPLYLPLALAYVTVLFSTIADRTGRPTLYAWEPLSRLGALTYSSYMLHPLVATTLLAFVLPRLLGTSPTAGLISIAIGIGVTMVASVISYRYFEIPAREFINGLGKRKSPVAKNAAAAEAKPGAAPAAAATPNRAVARMSESPPRTESPRPPGAGMEIVHYRAERAP